jgi:DNA processing protein
LATGCADRGFTVVSGAAYGIDSSAHRAALAARGPTVAVLACGIDRAYPARNEGLIERIAMHGCVATEVPPGSAPTRWRFLERNRLTAAMTTATVVVEAAWRSGAIGTANRALEYGRPVGAVPGPVTASMSAGCHRLLRQGATCVTDVQELFELLTPIGSQPEADPAIPLADHDGLSPLDVRVLDALPLYTGAPLDRLAGVAGVEVSDVRAALGRLQLRQLAEQADGRWRRCRPGR